VNEHREVAEGLRRHLAEHDVACPACGYNLRGLTGMTCPECGSPVELPPERARWPFHPADRPFVGGVGVALAAIAGWVIAIAMSASDPLWLTALWVPVAMLVALVVLVCVWAVALRHWGRTSQTWAFVNASVPWLMGVVFFLLLLGFVFAAIGNR
jgi:hypothetical protein